MEQERSSAKKIKYIVKRKCIDLETILNEKKQNPRNIFYSVVSNYPHVNIDFFEHQRGIQLLVKAAIPKNPSNCDDIEHIFQRDDIAKLLGTTKCGRTFYNGAFECAQFSFCLFSSPATIELFESVDEQKNTEMLRSPIRFHR